MKRQALVELRKELVKLRGEGRKIEQYLDDRDGGVSVLMIGPPATAAHATDWENRVRRVLDYYPEYLTRFDTEPLGPFGPDAVLVSRKVEAP